MKKLPPPGPAISRRQFLLVIRGVVLEPVQDVPRRQYLRGRGQVAFDGFFVEGAVSIRNSHRATIAPAHRGIL